MANWWDDAPRVDVFDEALKAEGVTGKAADIARSIYQQESGGGRNTRTSNAGAVGGMQIVPATFESVADKGWNIADPVANARAGIRYVKQGFDASGGDSALTGAYYYGGPGGMAKARQGVAVRDPRNPNAPDTLQYGQQVAARLPKERGVVQRAVEAIIPSAQAAQPGGDDWWKNAPLAEAPTAAPGAAAPPSDVPRAEVRGTSADEAPADQPGIGSKLARAAMGAVNPLMAFLPAQTAGNMAGGLVQGAADIGATVMAPFDAAYRATGLPENDYIGRTDRRAAITAGLGSLGADTGSTAFGAGRVGANIAGTAGIGGAVAAPLRLLAPNALAGRIASGLSSGGLSLGQGGSVLGNMATRIGTGAVVGGLSAGAIDPSSAGIGATIGAVAPPLLVGAGRLGGGAAGVVRAGRDMMTAPGQQRVAEAIYRASATDPAAAAATAAAARPVVPGSVPTTAQVAADPGLAQLERTLVNDPRTAGALNARFAEQRAARGAVIDDVAATAPGSGTYYDDIKEGRRIFAKEDYDAARKAGIDPAKAEEMAPQIESLMGRPSMKAAVADARRLAAETGETIEDMGSVQGLDWMKRALDNQISKATGANSSIGKADLKALQQTRDDLNSTLEYLVPEYKEAVRNYAAMSKQVNSMDVARKLDEAYTPVESHFLGGASAEEQGAQYMKALRKAQESVKGSTGQDKAIGDVMNTGDVAALENVAKDLARKTYAQKAGRAVGSPTAQNIGSGHIIRSMMEGAGMPGNLGAGATWLNTLLSPISFAGKLAEPQIMNRLAELAITPQQAAAALQSLPPQQANQLALKLGIQVPRALTTAIPASVPRIEVRGTSND